jgi:hypothetical protein
MVSAVEAMYAKVIEEHCKDAEMVFELLESQTIQDVLAIEAVQDQLFMAVEKYFEEFEATVLVGYCAVLDNAYLDKQKPYRRFLALPPSLAVRLLRVQSPLRRVCVSSVSLKCARVLH